MELMLMRHAKSDWESGARDDHSRPLNTRGVRSAERMGEAIRELGLIPDIVISSTATRARSTAELARIAGGWPSRLILEDGLYGASHLEAIATAARLGGGDSRVMLVGHEPTWSQAVKHLTGARCAMRTATCAVIEIHGPTWADVSTVTTGTLISLLQPRHFLA